LFIRRNYVSLSLVFNRLEIQQAQVFALFPMLVGLFADINRWQIRDDVRSLQQSARIEFARSSIWRETLRFRVVLVRLQQHEELPHYCPATVVLVCEFVNGRLGIMDIDALRMHPLIAVG
jgi:hypothetical protein